MKILGFPNFGVTIFGVPIMRIIVFGCPRWISHISGNYHIWHRMESFGGNPIVTSLGFAEGNDYLSKTLSL